MQHTSASTRADTEHIRTDCGIMAHVGGKIGSTVDVQVPSVHTDVHACSQPSLPIVSFQELQEVIQSSVWNGRV